LTTKLYAKELLEKIVKGKELRILEVVNDPELDVEQQLELLLKEK
jgi:hypothetical protein